MKTFAQFMIDEGLASQDKVLSALVKQSDLVPSLPSALVSMQIYSHEQMLDIFAYQALHVVEFKAAAIALGLWNEAFLRKPLEDFYASTVRPIGDILLESGVISLEQLTDALSRYVTVYGGSCLETSQASSGKMQAGDKRLYHLYCQHFNEQRRARLKTCLEQFNVQDRETLSHEIRTLRTAAHMIFADISVQLADGMLKALEHSPSPDMDSALQKAFDLLWQLREAMAEGGSESGFLADGKQDATVDSICQNLSVMGAAA